MVLSVTGVSVWVLTVRIRLSGTKRRAQKIAISTEKTAERLMALNSICAKLTTVQTAQPLSGQRWECWG